MEQYQHMVLVEDQDLELQQKEQIQLLDMILILEIMGMIRM